MRKHALNGSVHQLSVSESSSTLARIDSNVVIGSAFAFVWRKGVFKSELLLDEPALCQMQELGEIVSPNLF